MDYRFSIAQLPRITFGCGVFRQLPTLVSEYGCNLLVVVGAASFTGSQYWEWLQREFDSRGIRWQLFRVEDEPSPALVDSAAAAHRERRIDLVLGIGGGSVLDAAKAIAGMLGIQGSVEDYLEGVGPELEYTGPGLPFIAVPTTAGTGSEATKNAVLSRRGEQGFKKSFRHQLLVARHAVVDPDLMAGCPARLIAANGMDALTQLIEAYVSTGASVFTDALVEAGLKAARDGLLAWYEDDSSRGRERMAFAALISGIALAQTGLGSVHGLASPLGAFFPIPHGVVCGTLVATATRVNIEAMTAREPDNRGLNRYARVAEILCARTFSGRGSAWGALTDLLQAWTERLDLPVLARYGVTAADLTRIADRARGGSMKTNPIRLSDDELYDIMRPRL